ncbi:hypothetical protein [Paenibacillus sp. WLX2291]|uniref:hypothetical protein n=1 Tax=Paenibacillus sp. WLX2291 TaxID=3296934 RepID=UPI0039844478
MNLVQTTLQLFATHWLSSGNAADTAAQEISSFTDKFWNWFTDTGMWTQFAFSAIRIVLIFSSPELLLS